MAGIGTGTGSATPAAAHETDEAPVAQQVSR
jgi:hypothetical protein